MKLSLFCVCHINTLSSNRNCLIALRKPISRSRTGDLVRRTRHTPAFRASVRPAGFEPATSSSARKCSNPLSYGRLRSRPDSNRRRGDTSPGLQPGPLVLLGTAPCIRADAAAAPYGLSAPYTSAGGRTRTCTLRRAHGLNVVCIPIPPHRLLEFAGANSG